MAEGRNSMASWHRRLATGTRGRILALLRRSDQTIAELAEELGISGNAVRTHMAALELDGLARVADATRETGGKPAQVYTLTEAGRELFPRAYASFLAALVGLLESREGTTAARRLLRDAGRRVAAGTRESPGDLRERVHAAADALRSLGGDVEVEVTASGWRLRGHGCPLSAVVSAQPQACVMAEAFVGALVGRPVTERCEKGERPRCSFEVKA